ncbi:MAG TPA: hypothetical protein VK689_11210 [Armatimonadota bacterium]|nr:hypothetical protein [Armatimonadota bacterium]
MKLKPGWVRLTPWETAAILASMSLFGICAELSRGSSRARSLPEGDTLQFVVLLVLLGVVAMTAVALAVFQDRVSLVVPEWLFPVRGRWVRYGLAGVTVIALAGQLWVAWVTAGGIAVMGAIVLWILLMAPVVVVARITKRDWGG